MVGICPNQHWPPVASETNGMTELLPGESSALSPGPGVNDSPSSATDWPSVNEAIPSRYVIGFSQTVNNASVPPQKRASKRDVTDYFPPVNVHAHFLPFLSAIGSARPSRGNLSGREAVYWLSAVVDRYGSTPDEPPSPPSAKRPIHVWVSDVNRKLFLGMLVRT